MAVLLRFAAKVGAVGGTVYYTKSIGVWGESSDAEKAYKTIYSLTAPYIQEVPVEVPEIPRLTDITSFLKSSWNRGVLASFQFLTDLPDYTSSLAKEGYVMISNQINAPAETS